MKYFLLLGMLSISSVLAQGEIDAGIQKDLKTAQTKLTEQREKTAEEKVKISTELTEMQQELLLKRRQADISRRSTSDNEASLRELKNREFSSSSEVSKLSEMLRTYGIQHHTKLLPGEKVDSRLDSAFAQETDQNASLLKRLTMLDAGLDRIERQLGGAIVEGNATATDGKVVEGKIAVFGPLMWFSSTDQVVAGSYHVNKNKVAHLNTKDAEAAKQVVAGQEAILDVDITGGKAMALASIDHSLVALIQKGGAWVYPIMGLALLALICAVIKMIQLIGIKQPRKGWADQVAELYLAGDVEAAVELAGEVKHPVAVIMPRCIQAVSTSVEVAEEVLYEQMIGVRDKLRSWLPFIAITAATAPLLGLLGTVSGLIRTFSVITVEGTGEAQSISGGISEALITTLFGLSVAIPAFMLHALLSRKSKGVEQSTERVVLGFLNEVRKKK